MFKFIKISKLKKQYKRDIERLMYIIFKENFHKLDIEPKVAMDYSVLYNTLNPEFISTDINAFIDGTITKNQLDKVTAIHFYANLMNLVTDYSEMDGLKEEMKMVKVIYPMILEYQHRYDNMTFTVSIIGEMIFSIMRYNSIKRNNLNDNIRDTVKHVNRLIDGGKIYEAYRIQKEIMEMFTLNI